MESLLAGLALVIVGLVSTFFGYRLFRILLPIYGAVAGFVLAWGWWGESAWLLALVVGVVFAVILAIAAYTIWSVFVGLAGLVLGFALAALIATTLNLWTWLTVLLAIVFAIGFGLLFIWIRNEMVIISTGLTGAASIARGVGEWFGVNGGFDARNSAPGWVLLAMAAIFIVFAILGIRYQWGRYRRLNLYGGKAPALAEPPATRAASLPVAAGSAPALAAGTAATAAVAGTAAVVAAARVEPPPEAAAAEAAVVESASEAVADAGDTPAASVAEAQAGVAETVAEVQEEAAEAVTEVEEGAAESVSEVRDSVSETVAEVQENWVGAASESRGEAIAAAAVAGAVLAETSEAPAAAAETEAPAAAEATAVSGAEAAVLAEGVANKVEEVITAAEAPEADEDAVSANVVEEVIKDIRETYSLEDIAKFKEKLEFVEGVGPAFAAKLVSAGVNTVLDLLQRGATRKGRLELAEATGISGKLILRWVNHADLYRIKGVGSEYADLLEAAGVDTVVELAHRNPANLYSAVVETNKARSLVRKEPVESQVEDWVAQAKKLPRVIQY